MHPSDGWRSRGNSEDPCITSPGISETGQELPRSVEFYISKVHAYVFNGLEPSISHDTDSGSYNAKSVGVRGKA